MFITSTYREYCFVKENYGYPEGAVVLTGQPRLDRLHGAIPQKGQVLIMPTWRKWIGEDNFSKSGKDDSFLKTEYYKKWNSLLNSKRLAEISEKYNLEIMFYLHREASRFINCFSVKNARVKLCDYQNFSPSELLMSSQHLITDYSSIQTDFAYMKKSLSYYHFDYDRFTKEHYQKGYFSYDKDGFGPVCKTEESLLLGLEKSAS